MFFLLFSLISLHLSAQVHLNIETGGVWQTKNNFQIPHNERGTRLDLADIKKGPLFHYRLASYFYFGENHGIRLLYAPFKLELKNTQNSNINFNNSTFIANQETTYTYQFNSYRLTYFYQFLGNKEHQFNLGFSAKIRDAKIGISQGNNKTSYDNVGFVPLLFIQWLAPISNRWIFDFTFDGLAGGPGRAFDIALKLRNNISQNFDYSFGYRTIEGGADNNKVYTFSWFHYLVFDFRLKF